MESKWNVSIILPALVAALLCLTFAGPGQGAQFAWTFTYQGQLMESGLPKNGTANMIFKLFDAPSGGNQAGQTITANGVNLTDGRFTIELDFTNGGIIPGVFDGYDRYLEITVDGTLLSPREKITAAPHSIFARELSVPCQDRRPDHRQRAGHARPGPTGRFPLHRPVPQSPSVRGEPALHECHRTGVPPGLPRPGEGER